MSWETLPTSGAASAATITEWRTKSKPAPKAGLAGSAQPVTDEDRATTTTITTTNMKLRFKVNQIAALRAGINAPTSVTDLEIDPTTLPEADRHLLADHMHEDGISVVQLQAGYDGTLSHYLSPTLIQSEGPSLDALLGAVRKQHAEVAAEAAAKLERQKQCVEEERERKAAAEKQWEQFLTETRSGEPVEFSLRYREGADTADAYYINEAGGNYYYPFKYTGLPEDIQTILQSAVHGAVEKIKAQQRAREIEREQQLDALVPFLTEEEKKLKQRGKLSLKAALERLASSVAEEIAEGLLKIVERPCTVSPEHTSNGYAASHWTPDMLRLAEQVEAVTSRPVTDIRDWDESTGLNTSTQVPWRKDPLDLCVEVAKQKDAERDEAAQD